MSELTSEQIDAMDDGYTQDDAWKAAEVRLRYEGDLLRISQELEENPARGAKLSELAAFLGTTVAELRETYEAEGTLF